MTREFLARFQFLALESQFLLLVVLSWVNAPAFFRSLRIERAALGAAAAACGFTLLLVVFVVPRTNRTFDDEFSYEGVAENMSDLHLAQACNDGSLDHDRLQCGSAESHKQPDAYPYLLSVLYRIGGVRESAAHRFNAVCT